MCLVWIYYILLFVVCNFCISSQVFASVDTAMRSTPNTSLKKLKQTFCLKLLLVRHLHFKCQVSAGNHSLPRLLKTFQTHSDTTPVTYKASAFTLGNRDGQLLRIKSTWRVRCMLAPLQKQRKHIKTQEHIENTQQNHETGTTPSGIFKSSGSNWIQNSKWKCFWGFVLS